MPDTRAKPDRDSPYLSRAQRGEAALVAQYLHELSERHGGAGHAGPGAVESEPGGDGAAGEEGG
jgi:hypothetical protein